MAAMTSPKRIRTIPFRTSLSGRSALEHLSLNTTDAEDCTTLFTHREHERPHLGPAPVALGQNGHLGFNEPLSALRSRTRVKALAPATRAQNAPLFERPEDVPRHAITMGVGTILECRRCLLLATGPEKAGIIAQAVEGPITSMISATTLQLHSRCTVIVDESAASRLQGADYYRWIFANEPEWEPFR